MYAPDDAMVLELELRHTFPPGTSLDALKRALLYRSYEYSVVARDARCIAYDRVYAGSAALEALLGVPSVMTRHTTTFDGDARIRSVVRGSIDAIGARIVIDVVYTADDAAPGTAVAHATLRVLGLPAAAHSLAQALMRKRFAEERAAEERALRTVAAG